jgi:hypothetical protein
MGMQHTVGSCLFSLIIILVKYVSIDGIPQAFVFFRFSLPQEVRGTFVIKAAVEMQNNLPFCD